MNEASPLIGASTRAYLGCKQGPSSRLLGVAKDRDKMRGKHSPASSSSRHHRACAPSIYMAAVEWILMFSPLVQSCEEFDGYVVVDEILDEFNTFTHPYDEVFAVFHQVASKAEPILKCRGKYFLGAKDLFSTISGGESPPARWIKLPLRGETAEDRCTLAFSDSDLSLIAFKNNQDKWHTFKGYENMFPGAIVMNDETWKEGYNSLIGGYKQLVTVPLGKKSLQQAQSGLARHRQGVTPTAQLKQNLVRPMVMFSESLRFKAIRKAFSGERWEMESHLTEKQAGLVQHWGQFSLRVYKWCRDDIGWPDNSESTKISEDTGIQTIDEAFDSLDLVIYREKLHKC